MYVGFGHWLIVSANLVTALFHSSFEIASFEIGYTDLLKQKLKNKTIVIQEELEYVVPVIKCVFFLCARTH